MLIHTRIQNENELHSSFIRLTCMSIFEISSLIDSFGLSWTAISTLTLSQPRKNVFSFLLRNYRYNIKKFKPQLIQLIQLNFSAGNLPIVLHVAVWLLLHSNLSKYWKSMYIHKHCTDDKKAPWEPNDRVIEINRSNCMHKGAWCGRDAVSNKKPVSSWRQDKSTKTTITYINVVHINQQRSSAGW